MTRTDLVKSENATKLLKFYMLPFPPSVNNLFLNVKRGGRVKTPRYREWIEEAGLSLNTQHVPRYDGRVYIIYRVNRPDKRRRDISNLVKPIEDLLVLHGVLKDDSLIDGFEIRWDGEGHGMFFSIAPSEYNDQ